MLDKLLGELSFDPLSFAHSSSRDKATLLRKLMNLDTTELETKRRSIYLERSEVNRLVKELEGRESMMSVYKDAPNEEIPLDEISKEMLEAEQKSRKFQDLQSKATQARYQAENQVRHRDTLREKVASIQEQLDKLVNALKLAEEDAGAKDVTAERAQDEAEIAEKQIPDSGKLKARVAQIEKTNFEVRENEKRNEVIAQRLESTKRAVKMSLEIQDIDSEKAKMLAEAVFPIEGLGLDGDNVTFQDIPLDQASTAEQLRVSVAIGLALNPKLKVILIRDGSALDSDSMKAIADQAKDADAQLWLERVAESKDGVSVLIEDGSVK